MRKKFILKFRLEFKSGNRKILTLKICPTRWKEIGIPDGAFFMENNCMSIFIDSYEVISNASSPDWNNFFIIDLSETGKLNVRSEYGDVYLNMPECVYEPWCCLKGVYKFCLHLFLKIVANIATINRLLLSV